MDRVIHEIKSIGDIQTISKGLDEHIKIDSFMQKGKEFVNVPNHKFIWNIQKERIANSVSKNFQLIQNREVFSTVHNALKNLNLDVKGRLDDMEDTVRMDIMFKDQKLINDGEKGIELGIRVANSNNKKSSFKLEMYAFRMVCLNGMTIGNLIPEAREVQIHFGNEKIMLDHIEKMTEKFIKKVINSSDKLQQLVNIVMKDSTEWEMVKIIMEKLIMSRKYMKSIAEKIGVDVVEVIDKETNKIKYEFVCDAKQSINRWDLYNAITNVISHDEQLKPTAQKQLENSSRIILKNPFRVLEELYVKA